MINNKTHFLLGHIESSTDAVFLFSRHISTQKTKKKKKERYCCMVSNPVKNSTCQTPMAGEATMPLREGGLLLISGVPPLS